ncbi:MAG: dephospho-CoA kinase [Pseudomonadota bacterium]
MVGLTGGIASGKSTVAQLFKSEGAYIIDLDGISREVVEPGTTGWKEVVNVFGKEVLNDDQTLDRKKLGEIVFSDLTKRKLLEAILHPKIYEAQVRQVKDIAKRDGRAVVIIDIPLLIEVKRHGAFDRVVLLVYVSPEIQLERLRERNGLSVEEASQRISSQMSIDSKINYAHYIINNEGPLEKTAERVKEVFRELKKVETENRLRSKH